MLTRSIRIADIVTPGQRHRALQPSVVDDIAASIGRIGLRTPITVRMVAGAPVLVTGEHRVQAMLKAGKTHIEAVVFDDADEAGIWAIDENLARADLTTGEKKRLLARRAELIGQRLRAAKKAPPMHDERFTTREAASFAGQPFYFPAEQCRNGHDGYRYTSTGDCVDCKRRKDGVRKAKRETAKVANNSPSSPFRPGRGQIGGDRAAARELGVSKDTIRTARIFTSLTDRAQEEAVKLGLASKHHVIKYAAAHHGADLQIRALRSEARKIEERAARQRQAEATIRDQAAAATAPREMPLIDHQREVTEEYWLWLIERYGGGAYFIVNRLREVNLTLLLKIADKAKADGDIKTDTPPKSSLH